MKTAMKIGTEYQDELRAEFSRRVNEATNAAFERYLGTAGAAMHIPHEVREAAESARRSEQARMTAIDVRVMGRPTVEVAVRSGNTTHPVISVEAVVTFAEK